MKSESRERCRAPEREGKVFNDLSRLGKYLGQAARLMVGVPDYETYVAHVKATHPERPVMSYEEFFRDRQEARYGGGAGRCC
jgi:uncharacterized short protein YbdD (DUF466 family)